MWLRAFTATMLVGTVCLMLVRPLIVGPLPHRPAKPAAALAYSERALAFTVLLIIGVSGAGVGAILLARRAKEEYRLQAMANMQALIESTIRDQSQKADGQSNDME